jgi:ABC-2 type transport system permease protein
MNIFKKIYNYRELLKSNVKKEIRGRYKNSVLGVMWSFLNPLLQLLVYAVIFGALLGGGDSTYHIYICVALIPWTYFTTTITQASFTVIGNGDIIKKVYFPREILPISVVTSGAVNFVISTIIILAFVIFSGIGISKYIILYPFILLVQYILLLGISFIVSSITVYFRDLEHIIGIILMAAFYGTPIVYKLEQLPANLQILMKLNPMTHLINGYRDIFYYQQMPNMKMLCILLAGSLVITVIGYFIFKKLQKGFVEQL